MNKKYKPFNPKQSLLFPPSIEDFVSTDHVSHFLRRVVSEELNLKRIYAGYSESRGAPPYSPEMMVSLLLYAYMRGEYSSRRIATSCQERVDFMAVAAMNKPDFRTISKFRVRHAQALEELFVQVVKLCDKAGLVDLKHVAIDGTKMKGNASWSKNKSYGTLKSEEKVLKKNIKDWFKNAEELDKQEDEEYGEDNDGEIRISTEEALEKIRQAKRELEKRDKESKSMKIQAEIEAGRKPPKKDDGPKESAAYNFTDPDSRVLSAGGGLVQGYNSQLAVDSKKHVIVNCYVTNAGNDKRELPRGVEGVRRVCKRKPKEVSADTDYFTEPGLRFLEKKKVRGYIAAGAGNRDSSASARALPKGSLRAKMSQRLRKGARRTRYRLRKITVEPVFGIIKAVRNFRQFHLRGLSKVNIEWSLICTAHNLWKLKTAS